MARLFWTFFGMILAIGLSFGAAALGWSPALFSAALPPRIVVTFDSEAEALRAELTQTESERDSLAADLARVERDRDGLLGDLGLALAERDRLRERAVAAAPDATPPAAIPPAPKLEEGPAPGTILAPAAAPPARSGEASPSPGTLLWRGLEAYRRGDYQAAFDAWLPAARAGHARAQFHLGGLYGDGAGVPRNLVQAYVWLKRSEKAGYHRASGLLSEIVPKMTAEQLVIADQRARAGTL